MDHVFISYSRQDTDFCEQLASWLEARGVDVWVDREDIAAATVWRDELRQAIVESTGVVLLITPDSMASGYVRREIDQALELGKSIVPVVIRPTQRETVPDAVREIQWIDVTSFAEEAAFGQIFEAVRRDHPWRRLHSVLLYRAEAWERGDGSLLLRNELGEAVAWLDEADDQRRPTALHRRYIQASRELVADLIADAVLGGQVEMQSSQALAVAAVEEGAPTPKAVRALYSVAPRHGLGYRHIRSGAVNTARFSPCGKFLVVSFQWDPTVGIYDVNTGVLLEVLEGHSAEVLHAESSADGRWIASVSQDGTARLWEWKSRQLVEQLEHPRPIREAAFSPVEPVLATACMDRALRLWDLKADRCTLLIEHESELCCVRFYPDGARVAVMTVDGHVHVYDREGKSQFRFETAKPQVNLRPYIDVSADGRRLLTASNKRIFLWCGATGALKFELSYWGNGAALSPEGERILLGAGSSILVCHSGDGEKLVEIGTGFSAIGDVAWSPNGERYVACGMDGMHLSEEPTLASLVERTKEAGRRSLSDDERYAAFLPARRPSDPETFFQRARIQAQWGDIDLALAELTWAIEAGFDDAERAESDNYLGWISEKGDDGQANRLRELLTEMRER